VTERQMAGEESRNSWTLFMEILAFFHCYHHMIWYICWSRLEIISLMFFQSLWLTLLQFFPRNVCYYMQMSLLNASVQHTTATAHTVHRTPICVCTVCLFL